MMRIEALPLENPESNEIPRTIITGEGINELCDGLSVRVASLEFSLQEKRPLCLVTEIQDQPASLVEELKALVLERLDLNQEAGLIIHIPFDELDDELAQHMINTSKRPCIIPIKIDSGGEPDWWIGPNWMFHSPGNVDVFRRQFAEAQP